MAEIFEIRPTATETKKEPAPSPGFGEMLRQEREKKGLSLDQVASVTKLRVRIVEALENEMWEDLPHPVFVKGFIKGYAGILDLDAKELLLHYERVAPVHADATKPVQIQRRSYKGLFALAAILALFLVLIGYLQRESPSPSRERVTERKQVAMGGGEDKGMSTQATDQPLEGVDKGSSLGEEKAALPEAPRPLEVEQAQAAVEPEGAAAMVPASEESEAATPSVDALVLSGDVVDLTWVRIQIDNGEPKEYIFRPGAKPQWKAKEGFFLTVGNAAGIELELNGTKLKSLGQPGKVVRVALPESFRPSTREN